MAILEAKLVLGALCKRYGVELCPGHSMHFRIAATLMFESGLKLKIKQNP